MKRILWMAMLAFSLIQTGCPLWARNGERRDDREEHRDRDDHRDRDHEPEHGHERVNQER
jgi:hypothetical protein